MLRVINKSEQIIEEANRDYEGHKEAAKKEN